MSASNDDQNTSNPGGTPLADPVQQEAPAPADTKGNSGDGTNKSVVQKLAKRHARTKKQREESKGGKAGHPGRFHGAILEFLQQYVDDYLALPTRSDGGRNTALAVFWNAVHGAFWERFTVDDARGTMPASDDADDAAVIASMNEDIKSWYRCKCKERGVKDAWIEALKDLRKPKDGPPKHMAGWQMLLSTRGEEVNELVEEEKKLGVNEGKHHLALRSAVARRLWDEEGEDEKQKLREAVEAEYQAAKARYEHLLTAQDGDPEVQANSRRRLAEVITPLLGLIGDATGLSHLTLIGGCPPKTSTDKYIVSVVHHGTTSETVPRDFFQFNCEGFRANILSEFCKFLSATTGKGGDTGTDEIPKNLELTGLLDEGETNNSENVPGTTQSKQNPSPTPATAPQREIRATTSSVPSEGADSAAREKVPVQPLPRPVRLRAEANTAMVRIVNALPDDERRKEIDRLNALPAMEFRWANSDAKMREIDGTLPPRARPKPKARAKAADDAAPSPFPPSASSSPSTSSSRSNSPPAANQDEVVAPSAAQSPTSTTSVVDSSPPSSSPSDNVPEWIKEHRARFINAPMLEEHQATWNRVVDSWVRFEEAHDYQTPQKGFPVQSRPREISLWIQNARNGDSVVNSERHAGFTKDWLIWWEKINPQWRARADGKLTIGGDGDWSELFRPGKCGFILVLECVRSMCVTASVEDFTYCLNDVDWVLTRALVALARRQKQSSNKTDQNGEDTTISGPGKKRRATEVEVDDRNAVASSASSGAGKRPRRRR